MNGNRVGIYARVSTFDQHTDNQLVSLRQFAQARGWAIIGEYVDKGISGARDHRPALDALMIAAKRRRLDIVLCWRFDRFSRSLKSLVLALDTFRSLGVQFVSQQDGVDTTTPGGNLMFGLIAAIAQYEREILRERIMLGLARARAAGIQLGRRKGPAVDVEAVEALMAQGKSQREACRALGVPRNSFWRAQQDRLQNHGRISGMASVEQNG